MTLSLPNTGLVALVVTCLVLLGTGSAAAQLSFTDITLAAGTGGPPETGGHGAVFADVDDDDRPDLYITMIFNDPMPDLFFRNTGSNDFADEGALRGISDYDGGSHGAAFADLDNDGDYDLYNGTTAGTDGIPGENDLFENDGNGFFDDVTSSSGIPFREWPTRGVVAFDMEGDGDLDLFAVTNYRGSDDPEDERNEIYRNDGNFRFTAINSGDLYEAQAGQGATGTDYDGDGDIDIFAANRTGDVNILRNNGSGSFTQVTPSSIGINDLARDGISTGDVDNDGDLDLLLVDSNDFAHLYSNDGDGTFTFEQMFVEFDGYMGGFADLDNDGDLDLVFAGDDVSYLNDGTGSFETGPEIPVAGINDPRAVAFADVDDDGDVDFAFGCKRSRNWLIRNNLNDGNWLKVRLISPQGMAGAFGAKTRIFAAGDAGGAQLGLRESRSSNGYLGQDDPVLHFGLGPETLVDVMVEYQDGTLYVVPNIEAGQTITIDGRVPPPPDSWSLTPVADTFVKENDSRSYGGQRRLLIREGPGQLNSTRFAYLKFDTSSVSEGISRATLKLSVSSPFGMWPPVTTFELFEFLDSSWMESINWENRPSDAAMGEVLGSSASPVAPAIWEIDVSDYVNTERSAGNFVISFTVRSTGVSIVGLEIDSRESVAPPELILEAN